MKLSAKTISINENTELKFHPLTKKLYKILMQAYVAGGQKDYLISITQKFECYSSLLVHQIAMISSGNSKYQIIGGCFTPFFDIKNLNNNNAIFLNYCSTRNVKSEYKARAQKEFEQDIINFVYFDFIRAISILSLAKPGVMYPELREVTQEFESNIWDELFSKEKNSTHNYLLQKDFASLIGLTRDAVGKQAKDNK